MNWWHWWLSQEVISGIFWIILCPSLGKTLLKVCGNPSIPRKTSLEFILGFGATGALATLFVPLHRGGLPLLSLLLLILKFKKTSVDKEKHDWVGVGFLLAAALPIMAASFLYPTAVDSNLGGAQFSLFHDVWAMDWKMRLDTQLSLPFLLSPWFEDVPLINSLSVQSFFFSILAWIILDLCLELVLRRKATIFERIFLLAFFLGSIFYRRQIYVKASPLGGLYALLTLTVLGDKTLSKQPKLIALLISLSFYWGEVGALMMAPVLLKLAFSKESSESVLRALPLSLLLTTPAFVQKIWIFSGGEFSKTLIGGAILAIIILASFSLLPFLGRQKFKVPYLEETVFFLSLALSFLASFFLKVEPQEGAINGAYFFSVQREGLLLVATLCFIWLKREETWSKVLLVFSGIQFSWFTLWRLAVTTGLSQRFNPSNIWQNLVKDAMMISFPLMTTVVGVVVLSTLLKNNKFKNQIYWVVLLFFLFLQDPLVKGVADGPLAPHAPRLSAMQSLHDLFWMALRRGVTSSTSGNVAVMGLAIKEPDMVEKLFSLQKITPKQLNVCIDDRIPHEGIADFDVQAYTVEYPTGSHAFKLGAVDDKICDVKIISKNERTCPAGSNTLYSSNLLLTCIKDPLPSL